MATLEYIIGQCITKLRLQAGLSVNTYTEDRLAAEVQLQFRKLFAMKFWDDYMSTVTYALDSSTGTITGTLAAQVTRFTDIEYVWVDDSPTPLKRAPRNANPASLKKPFLLPYNTDATKLFVVTNPENITNVTVSARKLPDEFDESSEIVMDETLLIYSTLYSYTVETGINKDAAEMFGMMFKQHLDIIMGDQHFAVVDGNPYSDNVYIEWYGI